MYEVICSCTETIFHSGLTVFEDAMIPKGSWFEVKIFGFILSLYITILNIYVPIYSYMHMCIYMCVY